MNDAIKDMGMPVSRSEAVRCGGVGLVGAVVVAVVFSGLATVM